MIKEKWIGQEVVEMHRGLIWVIIPEFTCRDWTKPVSKNSRPSRCEPAPNPTRIWRSATFRPKKLLNYSFVQWFFLNCTDHKPSEWEKDITSFNHPHNIKWTSTNYEMFS
jgi:hypothetical protein